MLLELSQLFTRRSTVNLDLYWRSLSLWENNNFIIWTFYTMIIMWVLRPNERSPKLEDTDKLLYETWK